MRTACRLSLVAMLALTGPAFAQDNAPTLLEPLPPQTYGTLRQDDLALRIQTPDIEIRFVPLDLRVAHLLARDTYESLRGLVLSRRGAIDSLASTAGVSRPGLALVTFFGQRSGARFDPQTLTLVARNRILQPLGIVPFAPRFNSQQLEVREQVSGIYLFEESIPVTDEFVVSYEGRNSDNWVGKRATLDRERARVASRARAQADTAHQQ